MTSQQYLEEILAKYNLTENDISGIQKRRKEIEDLLRYSYGSKISRVYYSGSYAKGTAINLKYDVDLCVYFKGDAFYTLQDMYNQVFASLRSLNPRKQIVSIRISNDKESVDIVPAREISNNSADANLFVTTTGSSIKTNIELHKDYVSKAKCRPIIKLMKIWKYRHSIHFKSFALELLIIKALDNSRTEDYGELMLQALRYTKENVELVKLIDPANSNNIVSDLITSSDKLTMKNNANASLEKTRWEDIVW
ncbi:MAG: nucleotidyltransferase [Planctomycetes bacterium]|nr:nucleotidyltransferase [Planctomycetota bacterium]